MYQLLLTSVAKVFTHFCPPPSLLLDVICVETALVFRSFKDVDSYNWDLPWKFVRCTGAIYCRKISLLLSFGGKHCYGRHLHESQVLKDSYSHRYFRSYSELKRWKASAEIVHWRWVKELTIFNIHVKIVFPVQWLSKYRTSLVFKWSICVLKWNGPILECYLCTGNICRVFERSFQY
jgi:hypothetical protein